MTTTNTIFSLKRISQLARHHLVIDRKASLLRISGFCISIVILLFIGQIIDDQYRRWSNIQYYSFFVFFYFLGGVLYTSNSFKWLRSKESRYSYLMIPATSFEKFFFEFFIRIVAYIVLVPFIYWLLANIEGTIFHMFAPDFVNFQFSFSEGLENSNLLKDAFWPFFITVNTSLLFFIVPFSGVTFFKKSPFPKVLLSLAIIVIALFIYGILLYKLFGLKHYSPDNIFYISSNYQFKVVSGISIFTINVISLFIGFYNVKEKEV